MERSEISNVKSHTVSEVPGMCMQPPRELQEGAARGSPIRLSLSRIPRSSCCYELPAGRARGNSGDRQGASGHQRKKRNHLVSEASTASPLARCAYACSSWGQLLGCSLRANPLSITHSIQGARCSPIPQVAGHISHLHHGERLSFDRVDTINSVEGSHDFLLGAEARFLEREGMRRKGIHHDGT